MIDEGKNIIFIKIKLYHHEKNQIIYAINDVKNVYFDYKILI